MSEMENGWYLRSDGYMTSECCYQRIGSKNASRSLDNHARLVFVKFVDGNEVDSRVYTPYPGVCEVVGEVRHFGEKDDFECELSCGHYSSWPVPRYCGVCGAEIRR